VSRPICCRRVTGSPGARLFSPVEAPQSESEAIVMSLDEFEAIRLADGEGMKQEDAAVWMQVSRPTFGRVLESAHRKVAAALTAGSPLRIEGGTVCTDTSCGPRDCPRWHRRGPAGSGATARSGRMPPCGRAIPGTREESGRVRCEPHGALSKGEHP
jgi:predicted DNA-binding protein (UPF0251 family)